MRRTAVTVMTGLLPLLAAAAETGFEQCDSLHAIEGSKDYLCRYALTPHTPISDRIFESGAKLYSNGKLADAPERDYELRNGNHVRVEKGHAMCEAGRARLDDKRYLVFYDTGAVAGAGQRVYQCTRGATKTAPHSCDIAEDGQYTAYSTFSKGEVLLKVSNGFLSKSGLSNCRYEEAEGTTPAHIECEDRD